MYATDLHSTVSALCVCISLNQSRSSQEAQCKRLCPCRLVLLIAEGRRMPPEIGSLWQTFFLCLYPTTIHAKSLPCLLPSLSTLLSPCIPLTFVYLFLNNMSFFSLSPFHRPSICPAALQWYELMCQVSWSFPPAAVCQPQLSFPHVSLWLFLPSPLPLLVTLTASVLSIFHSIMSTAVSLFLSPIPSFPSLLPPSLLFPRETGLSWRFVHLSISSQILFRLCVYVCCAICWVHTCICMHETQGKREGSVRVL